MYGTIDWFKIEKRIWQGCLLSPCLFNLYTEYIKRNAELDELHAGIKIAGRNINNLRYADFTTLSDRKRSETEKPLDEAEARQWKSWLETKY